ncbi:MAG TPA: GntR family transcriptional regulator [Solirubrobacteraceae bacterium]|nr:GntR family transcriptional regulator [Solirubrobacteraceae bacterium]
MTTRTGITPISTESQSLVDRVSHAVRRAILEGRLRPGEALSISDLARDLGVSLSPVREALQRLSGQGLVLLRPARTAIVAPLELSDLQELYRLRRLIEVDAAARAAPMLGDEQLSRLERELHAMSDRAVDSEEFWNHHNGFHRTLLEPVLTARTERLITELWQAVERYLRIVYIETDALFERTPHERHSPLLDAARTRDPDAVASALTAHLESNEREVVKSLQQSIATPGR